VNFYFQKVTFFSRINPLSPPEKRIFPSPTAEKTCGYALLAQGLRLFSYQNNTK